MSRTNKLESTQRVLSLVSGHIVPCTKLSLDNILFPKWADLGLYGKIFAQYVKTKEQPEGCDYPENTYQVVMRILGGKLYMTGGRPDAYAWGNDKVAKEFEKGHIKPIGCNTGEGLINLSPVLLSITDPTERMDFAEMFSNSKRDYLLVHTDPEDRMCVEVTPELYMAGVTSCVDEWMKTDSDGNAEETTLCPGDYLIISPKGGVYCIRKAEFNETHALK